ncbi:hypothetical protein FDH38_gp091 [Dinoroseobacter phage vB_DshS-R5C]|uniref:dATP/dGTP diphosphohydrolase MazZ domain-containing protein n=1 Tax=Dinoroseobacter phage vB_DshS-R5C TaxID=1965368 RepID=A0A1V0DYC4_9CAUD|nr:hypothetical protein FDH38_gp091 [Dinoroseobacter phage vB_DshS-R5C]ARB06145.1 hypothetical protein vBDshSR5C_91 [Dinoroseobacter phage vB_DshS-R5C]
MFDTFHDHLSRQCAVGREKFGPGERTKGVMDHIRKEFDEIEAEETPDGRAEEWTDVAILGLDGLLRAVREMLRKQLSKQEVPHGINVDRGGNILGYNGEPTNDFVAAVACRMIRQKQAKNELRDFGNWRDKSEDVAIEHTRGIHD